MAEASPIGRGKNLTMETILTFIDAIPDEPMPKNKFLEYGERRMKGWRQTHSQIARQLALYYEDENGVCRPRFWGKVNPDVVMKYAWNWAHKYYIPNPFTPSLEEFVGQETNLYAFIKSEIQNGEHSFTKICNNIFGIDLNNLDKVRVYLTNFTGLIVNDDYVGINSAIIDNEDYEIHPNVGVDSEEAFFNHFSLEITAPNNLPFSDMPLQIIYYGAPGTGKSHKIDNDPNVTDDNTIRTTFHPDSDYSTFVGAYKPTKGTKPRYELNQDKTVRLYDENNKPLVEDVIAYQFIPQAFLKAYCKAWKNTDRPFFLVIEEINRGNCAQIFGDLFQLLDRNAKGFSSYAIDADEDIRKFIADSHDEELSLKDIEIQDVRKPNGKLIATGKDIKEGNKLLLPPNLHIWATMNTSDQSLFPIDSAFKRRWEWRYTPISEGIDSHSGQKLNWVIDFSDENEDGENLINWWQFIRSINELVETTTGSEDKKLGYFFCKADADGKISSDTFLSKVIFYLWNDVFRDYGFNSDVFKLNNGKAIKFHQFYNADGSPNKELLMNFAKKVIAAYDPIKIEEKTVNETAD